MAKNLRCDEDSMTSFFSVACRRRIFDFFYSTVSFSPFPLFLLLPFPCSFPPRSSPSNGLKRYGTVASSPSGVQGGGPPKVHFMFFFGIEAVWCLATTALNSLHNDSQPKTTVVVSSSVCAAPVEPISRRGCTVALQTQKSAHMPSLYCSPTQSLVCDVESHLPTMASCCWPTWNWYFHQRRPRI